jgi:hypothetical protein
MSTPAATAAVLELYYFVYILQIGFGPTMYLLSSAVF